MQRWYDAGYPHGCQQIPAQGSEHVPDMSYGPMNKRVKGAAPSVGPDYMGGMCQYVNGHAALRASYVAVAHQGYAAAVGLHTDYPVYHICVRCNLRQHDHTYAQTFRFLHYDAVPAAYDEREHAAALDGESHAHSVGYQAHGLLYDLLSL